jgi:hypothetical protein
VEVAQPAINEPVAGAAVGSPTTPLPFGQLLNLSVYWAGLNAVWAGLGFVVYPTRFTEMFGAALSPTYQTLFETIPVLLAVVVQPTVATISDYTISRWGRRKPYIFIGALLDVVFLYGFASSNVVLVMFVFIMLLQFSSNFAQGPFQGYVPDLVPKHQVGLASGMMGVMIVIGQVIGAGIAAIGLLSVNSSPYLQGTVEAGLYAQQAFLWPTVGLALVEVVTMVPLVLFVREGRSGPAREGRSWFQIGLSAWGADILREHSYVWMLVSRLFFLMAPALPLSLGLYYLRQSLGASDDEAAFTVGVMELDRLDTIETRHNVRRRHFAQEQQQLAVAQGLPGERMLSSALYDVCDVAVGEAHGLSTVGHHGCQERVDSWHTVLTTEPRIWNEPDSGVQLALPLFH